MAKSNGMNIISDEPLINDEELSTRNKALISVILDNILNETRQKIKTFAIYGNWGTGKTSVLRSVYQHFESKNKSGELSSILPVWFDAWRYQHEGDIYPALLREVSAKIGKKLPQKKEFWKSLAKAARAIAYGTKIKAHFLELDVGAMVEREKELSEEEEKWILSNQLATFGESPYFEAIKLLRKVPAELEQGESRGHVIIFIDDLDRCLPGIAFNLIEKLKIWIDIEGYTICLALNAKEIDKVIQKYFTDNLGIDNAKLKEVAEEYLLKICSLALYVDEDNEHLNTIIKTTNNKPYNELVNASISYRKAKSYYNINVLESLVKDKIEELGGN